jgi:two-component system LytT family sensor kinase
MNKSKLPFPYINAILIGLGIGLLWSLRDYVYIISLKEEESFNYLRLVLHLANYSTWGLIFPIVYRFMNWAGHVHDATTGRILSRILPVGLGLSLLHEVISNVLFYVPSHFLGLKDIDSNTLVHIIEVLPAALINRMVEFAIIYVIFTALEFQRQFRNKKVELAQMESQLSNAQLNALRLQLQPHFLFNTLNAISSLMDFDKKRAQKMVSQLGNLLRFVLEENKETKVPLRDEVEFIKNYLNIEEARFLDRLSISYDIAPDTLDATVPSLILQPLVENAIKHGFANQTGQGHIKVSSRKENGLISLIVHDDGNGCDVEIQQLLSSGIGLSNVKERLSLIYKGEAELDIKTAAGEGFNVQITLPYQRANI